MIHIVGAGPRGLAVALYALNKDIAVTLIDSKPLHTWEIPYIIPDIQMRSPVTFDLVTGLEELQEYSLSNFLKVPVKYSELQRDIEYNSFKPTRQEFISYLHYIYEFIKNHSKSNIIQEKVVSIYSSKIELETQVIDYSNLVLSIGSGNKVKIPNWIKLNPTQSKIIKLQEIIKNPPKNEEYTVVGSGQGAAEIVYYLAKLDNKVTWLLKHEPRIEEYPLPSYKNAYKKSGLGDYFTTIESWTDKLIYLNNIKAWQPSITPYINSKIDQVSHNITKIKPSNTRDIPYINKVILATGKELDIKDFNFKFDVALNGYLPMLPNIKSNFRIINTNIYVTGALAIGFDGPRQGSIISSGLTAKSIIESIYA